MTRQATGKVQIQMGAKVNPSVSKSFSQLKSGVASVGSAAVSIGTVVAGAFVAIAAGAAAATAAVGAMVYKYMQWGDELDKSAKRSRVTVEFFDQVSFAFEKAGGSVSEAESTLREFNKAAARAGTGNVQLTGAFAALGVSIRDTNGKMKTSEQLFLETTDALKNVEDQALKARTAELLFKGGADQLLLTLPSLRDEMEKKSELGVATTAQAEKAAALTDSLTNLKAAVFQVGASFAEKLMPHLEEAVNAFTDIYVANKEWVGLQIDKAAVAIGDGIKYAFEKSKEAYKQIKEWSEDHTLEIWWLNIKRASNDVFQVFEKVGTYWDLIKDIAKIGYAVSPVGAAHNLYSYATTGEQAMDPIGAAGSAYDNFGKIAGNQTRVNQKYDRENRQLEAQIAEFEARRRKIQSQKSVANAVDDVMNERDKELAEKIRQDAKQRQEIMNAQQALVF